MKGAVALSALVLAGCLAYPSVATRSLEADTTLLECATGRSRSVGTLTVVGDAEITARHVAVLCPALSVEYLPPASQDYAIVRAAPLPSCRDAEVGERVIYQGFPATGPSVVLRKRGEPPPQETDKGVVKAVNVPVIAFGASVRGLEIQMVTGTTRATMTRVRPGYSGGAVMSAKDGRFVGIISSVNPSENLAYFTPVSTICSKIKEITQ